ncbi:MAG TPA: fluoride efflux transporter CrcB [Candidatus Binatia bacterium]|nr:fluoride efflux transporter CrcB [Candidatus Binatia bacterium]
MERLLLVAVGGGIGSALRYVVSVVAARGIGSDFPYGTLLVNLVGSFFIGLVQELGAEALLLPDSTRLFLATGMLGGLTTYSTFSYETVRLLQAGAWPQAWINVVVTTAGCLGFCFLGIAAARLLVAGQG